MDNKEFFEALASGEVCFAYTKLNGELRIAAGTTNPEMITEHGGPLPKGTGQAKAGIAYYDTDSEGWRCFKEDRLIWDGITGIREGISAEHHLAITQWLTDLQFKFDEVSLVIE